MLARVMIFLVICLSHISAEPNSKKGLAIDSVQVGMSPEQCQLVLDQLGRARSIPVYPSLVDPATVSYYTRGNVDQSVTISFDKEWHAARIIGSPLIVEGKVFGLGSPMETIVATIGTPSRSETIFSDLSNLFDQKSSFDAQCAALGFTGAGPDRILTGENIFYDELGLTLTFRYVFDENRIRRDRLVLRSAELANVVR